MIPVLKAFIKKYKSFGQIVQKFIKPVKTAIKTGSCFILRDGFIIQI
ncbi:hypothetical protein TREAZ_3357 [Leadbettera azotonutricia ZAS-9]|uniref:Uncharacterized protein n=1 Tax=Leadbettera azotonutricia (strain ATCC BAA-888 / DSM 13862 / ZAS-9) TaxID=545695 RepID=F5Y8G3_LEAAZ|nr:hypothetical protein TREAZ_3357 [Leadbettera azotonutricia ZAS-9]